MTSNQVADMAECNVKVIPTRSIPQGVSAMLGFDGQQDTDTNFESMCEMAKGTVTMQVTYAARASHFDGLDIKEGEYLSLYEDAILKNDSSLDNIILAIADKIKECGRSQVSIYYGMDVTEEEAENMQRSLEIAIGDSSVEVNLYNGAQPVYYYIISAES